MSKKEEMLERAEKLNRKLEGKNFRIKVRECFKNNGTKLGYILVSEETNASPTVYFESMKEYWDNDEKLLKFLEEIFEDNKNFSVNPDEICNREYILDRVKPKLISDSNIEEVETNRIVYKRYLDMLVLFCVEISELTDKNGNATFTLNREHLLKADISEDEVFENAVNNIGNDYQIRDMKKVICDMLDIPEEEKEYMTEDGMPMYVISNRQSINGASVILSDKVLKEVYEYINGDFVILPSSVHECIAVPAKNSSSDELRDMVREVNDNEVIPEERLTYSVYIYKNNQLKIY